MSNVHRSLVIIFCLFFSSFLSAESPVVSVSILSILKPQQITITLRDPDRAMLRSNGSQRMLGAHAPLEVRLRNESLFIDSGESTESFHIVCAGPCLLELNTPGVPAREYRGHLRLTAGPSAINIVLQTEEESLLASIIASEMGEYSEPAALAAFAIVSRSFLRSGRRHPEKEADFCDLTHCQVFQAYLPSGPARDAARETAGLILKYRQKAFRPYYFRNCGGRTATFKEVWDEPSPEYPFASVPCSCDAPWNLTLDPGQLKLLFGMPIHKAVQDRNRLTMNGKNAYSLEELRILIGRTIGWGQAKSNFFTARVTGESLVIEGNGIGHRVGFCQNGAYAMARNKRSYQQILEHYFPNTEIRSIH
jgi:stage II sporulation protein D